MNSNSYFRLFVARFGVELSLVALLALGYYIYVHADFGMPVYGDVSAESRQTLAQIQATVNQAQLAEQDFLKTRNEKSLRDYNEKTRLLNSHMNTLRAQVGRSEDQRRKVAYLNKTIHDYFEKVNATLVLKQKGVNVNLRAPASIAIEDLIEAYFPPNTEKPWTLYRNEIGIAGIIVLVFLALISRYFERAEIRFHRQQAVIHNRKSILLDSILNSMSEALIVTDENGHFTHYNAAAQRIVGNRLKDVASEVSADELGFFDAKSGEALTLKDLPFQKALRGEAWDDAEIFVKNDTHPNGTYISSSHRPLNDIDGHISGALVVFKDVSRRKAVEQEWIRAREAAVEASIKKSDFLAAMSHEIRTPMNGVLGMTTLLGDTPLNSEQKEYVGVVKRSAESLLMLINDILDYSKIEAGKIALHPEAFDLSFLCKDILEIFRPAVAEKNISLKIDFVGDNHWLFVGDSGRIRQILVNLIGNAVKFTDRGTVHLGVSQMVDLKGQVRLRFEVQDTGPGLKEEDRRALFQKYFQTKTGIKAGGTGLGLSISKQLVDLMGGEIGVDSIFGKGSTFWFNISLPTAESHDVLRPHDMKFSMIFSGNILLVEDQIVNQKVAESYLRKLGLNVEIANNGQVACEKFAQKKFDLVFMDCQMPVMDGFQATARIRREYPDRKTPIIALTADGGFDRSVYIESGMDDFLPKPLELRELIATLSQWLPLMNSELDFGALEKLASYMVKDQSLIATLIDDLELTAPELLETMRRGVDNSDLVMMSQAAHALKSASAALGAMKLADLCATIEALPDFTQAAALVAQAEDLFGRSMIDLKNYHQQKKTA